MTIRLFKLYHFLTLYQKKKSKWFPGRTPLQMQIKRQKENPSLQWNFKNRGSFLVETRKPLQMQIWAKNRDHNISSELVSTPISDSFWTIYYTSKFKCQKLKLGLFESAFVIYAMQFHIWTNPVICYINFFLFLYYNR